MGTGQGRGRRGPVPLALALALSLGLAAAVGAEPVDPAAIRVIDGDTIERAGQSVRLVGFDTPETRHAQCDYERALGNQATARLEALVHSGAIVEVFMLPGRDRYGRGLGRLHVAGHDMGDVLIAEGLARPYEGGRRKGWCG